MAGIKHLITSHKKIPSAKPTDQLGSVLEAVKSSHDPIFVYDDDTLLVGIVSASYSLFKRRYPLNTKVKHAMRSPTRITPDTDIFKVIKRMLADDIYTLPVFENKKVIGIVTMNNILEELLFDNEIAKQVNGNIEIDKPFIVSDDARIRDIFHKLKNEKTSRVLITNNEGKLIGIATRRDIQEGILPPTRKLRYGKNHGVRFRSASFDEEKIKRLDYPIHEFMKRNVVTSSPSLSFKKLLSLMIENKINSVVIVDRNNKPIGVVTMRNMLSAIANIEPKEKITIKLSDKHKVLVEEEVKKVIEQLERFAEKIQRQDKIKNIETTVNAYHNQKGKVTGFEIHLRLHLLNGHGAMTTVEDKKLMNAVNNGIKKIKHQLAN